jgi:hypothetical protein
MSESNKVFAGSVPENYDRYCTTSSCTVANCRFGNGCWHGRRRSSIDAKTFAGRQLRRNRPKPTDA